MASVEETRKLLGKAEKQLTKAEDEVKTWKGRYGQRLTTLEDKLWSDEGTEAQREEWKEEKTKLEEETKLEGEVSSCRWSVELLRAAITAATQPGNDFVTRALGT